MKAAGYKAGHKHRGRGLTALMLAVFALSALSPVLAATALLPETEASPIPTQTAPPSQAIRDTSDAASDERIATRIRGIFAAVPALQNVTVAVSQGVVALDGKVPTVEDIDRAEQIASRIVGVVTVENGIERSLSVEDSVQSLGSVSQKFKTLVKMLPLIGAALLVALVIAAAGYLLASLTFIWRRLAPNTFLSELIASAVRFVFVIGGLIIALQMLGAGALLGAVLGGAGIIGIALGFAMRDTIENYVASILLSVRQPFRANDWVVIDSYEGRVIRLTSRATVLMTLDGNHLRIPNSTVFKGVILNYTRNPQRRFEFELGIDADGDANQARHIGVETLAALPFVLDEPPPSARLEQVGDSNIVLKFLGWIDQEQTDWYKARSRAIPAVKDALEAAGFGLPEPIYRLRFDPEKPLLLRNLDEAGHDAVPAPVVMSGEVPQEAVEPDAVIAEMVEKERSAGNEGEGDLLDPRRPVE